MNSLMPKDPNFRRCIGYTCAKGTPARQGSPYCSDHCEHDYQERINAQLEFNRLIEEMARDEDSKEAV